MHWQLQKNRCAHWRPVRGIEATGCRWPLALGAIRSTRSRSTAPLPDGMTNSCSQGFCGRSRPNCEMPDLRFEVPADCVFRIGRIRPIRKRSRRWNHFGDHTGYYSLPEPYQSSTWSGSRIGATRSIRARSSCAAHGRFYMGSAMCGSSCAVSR